MYQHLTDVRSFTIIPLDALSTALSRYGCDERSEALVAALGLQRPESWPEADEEDSGGDEGGGRGDGDDDHGGGEMTTKRPGARAGERSFGRAQNDQFFNTERPRRMAFGVWEGPQRDGYRSNATSRGLWGGRCGGIDGLGSGAPRASWLFRNAGGNVHEVHGRCKHWRPSEPLRHLRGGNVGDDGSQSKLREG